MLIYATTAQLTTWLGVASPSNATSLLRSASILVRRATLTAVYDIATGGMPTDADLVAALKDATCSQAATWIALAIDPAQGVAGAGKVVAAKSIGSASVTYATVNAAQAMADASEFLSQEAWLILSDVGLTSGTPAVFG